MERMNESDPLDEQTRMEYRVFRILNISVRGLPQELRWLYLHTLFAIDDKKALLVNLLSFFTKVHKEQRILIELFLQFTLQGEFTLETIESLTPTTESEVCENPLRVHS